MWRHRHRSSLAQVIVPFRKDFSHSGEHPEQHELAHTLWQLTDDISQIFHKYCCNTKHGGIKTNLTQQNLWGHITDMSKYHNADKWYMDQRYCVLCSKTYNTLHRCHNFLLVRDKPLGAPTSVKWVYGLLSAAPSHYPNRFRSNL